MKKLLLGAALVLALFVAGVSSQLILQSQPSYTSDETMDMPAYVQQVKDVQDRSVNVHTDFGQGSGVIFHRFGHAYVLTAAHVVREYSYHERVKVTQGQHSHSTLDYEGGPFVWEALVVNLDKDRDLALLRIVEPVDNLLITGLLGVNTEIIAEELMLPIGTPLIHVGNTLGYSGSFVRGYLSATGRIFDDWRESYDQTSVLAWPGSSGGGVFTEDGKLVGLITLGVGPGLNFIVPAREIYEWAREHDLYWLLE